MNTNLYRLVFSRKLGMYVPTHEAARSHAKGKARAVVVSALVLAASVAQARTPLTPPAGNTLPLESANFINSGSATINRSSTPDSAALTVNQTTRTLGLNWNSFDIGSNASVTFNQPDAGSRVLNRIWDANPSQIMGQLNANGQVFLVNQNGILFGNGAQVNVGGLVASALSISDDLLEKGLPTTSGDKLSFTWQGSALGFANSFVAVDPGATITTASGGRVVLLAPATAENLGRIQTGEGGEAILAAGGSVMLTAPTDSNLRGLLVEVESWQGVDALGSGVTLSGTVTNRADGVADSGNGAIDAPAGVVTLAALAVNQQGTVKAGKAVNLNGEIMLVAGATETPRLTVTQTADQASIDWQSGFNVAAGQTLEFVQPDAGAVAYNYIHDADRIAADGSVLDQAGRSSIDGVLSANGQLVLINERGIDFGSNARVSAANFVASALGINPDVAASGLYGQDGVSQRAFYLRKDQWLAASEADFDARRDEALALFREATVNVAAGASITAAEGGYVILAGGRVDQAGGITTPGGQALLAAGAEVYLKPPYAAALRGFTAEVNPLYVVQGYNNNIWQAISRGADANRVSNSGDITAAFGNITLVGYEVAQGGHLTASTSATRNGSIRLLARDQVADNNVENAADTVQRQVDPASGRIYGQNDGPTGVISTIFITGRNGGILTLAPDSVTQVILDGSDGATTTASQIFLPSSIEAAAAWIDVQGGDGAAPGARLTAQGGGITLTSQARFELGAFTPWDAVAPDNAAAGLFIGAGARIDASGATAAKSAADLFVEVQLRGDELANNPLQREGKLRGRSAWVDLRDPVAIADLAAYFDNVGQTLAERAASGGSIALRSQGSVIVKQDAVLDVSGGRVDYASANVLETRVVSTGGATYRLNDAATDLAAAGLVTIGRREVAYTEGKSAGSVELTGYSLALDGTLLGRTVRGERQRSIGDPAKDRYALPRGAKLVVRDAGQHYQPAGSGDADKAAAYGQAQMLFVAGQAATAANLNFGDAAGPRLELSQSLVEAGFSRFDLASDGRIAVPAGVVLDLPAGGEFKASGRQIDVGGHITAPSGSITLTTVNKIGQVGAPGIDTPQYYNLVLDEGAVLSTAGRWINDRLDLDPAQQAVKATTGGSISLNALHDLWLKPESLLDVSGGARLRSDGKEEYGNAGSIRLASGNIEATSDLVPPQYSAVFLQGELNAYSLAKGGSLEVSTSQIRFGTPLASLTPDLGKAERLAPADANDATALNVGATTLAAALLDQGGFNDFRFTGMNGLTVAEGVVLAPTPISWTLEGVNAYRLQASGTPIGAFARSVNLHPERRGAPTTLKLTAGATVAGNLTLAEGSRLAVDPQGSIELEAHIHMRVLGTLEARGGSLRLTHTGGALANPVEAYANGSGTNRAPYLYLGENSRLLAGGITRLDAATRAALEAGQSAAALRAQGLYRGDVLAGGRVVVDAGLGNLIARPGSRIDVSGAADSLSVASLGGRGAYQTAPLGSAGGSIGLTANDGLFLDGALLGSGGAGAVGGTFSVAFANATYSTNPWGLSENQLRTDDSLEVLLAPRRLTLYQSSAGHEALWPGDLSTEDFLAGVSGADLDPQVHNGQARLDLALLAQGGFGSWYLSSQGEMRFEGAITAGVANQLRLDSPEFVAQPGAAVTLSAAAVQIGNFVRQQVEIYDPVSKRLNLELPTPDPAGGGGRFRAEARDVGLVGNFAWSGFGETVFDSRGELHLDSIGHTAGSATTPVFDGGLRATGTLTLSAARVLPATYSDFIVDLSSDPAGHLIISRPEQSAALPSALAVGGRLQLKAPVIAHNGVIEAPLGQVVFTAPDSPGVPGSVTLGAGSVTSVAADEFLALGRTSLSGRNWEFLASNWNATATGGQLLTTLIPTIRQPEKAVTIEAADSRVAPDARIDLSGGGEALAWEFSPGPGGKQDVLAWTPGTAPTLFAILPGWEGAFAPQDSHHLQGYNVTARTVNGATVYDPVPALKPGDRIDIAANASGVTGSHTLLPAYYALLRDDAVLVSVKPPQDSVTGASRLQADGSTLVAGTRLAANADGGYSPYSQRQLTLELAPNEVVRKRALYLETSATGFLYDQPGAQLPGDAGRLSVVGRSTLAFEPVLVGLRETLIASGDGRSRAGRGAELDLAAPRIEVTDAGTQASGTGWTTLDKDGLNALGVASLLLGGTRRVDGNTANIETLASEVRIATSGNDPLRDALQGPEILLAATELVSIEAGSVLAADGEASAPNYVLSGDGAFLRVAGGAQAGVQRQGSVARQQGDLTVAAGATVSGRALVLDATRDNQLDGDLKLANLGEAAAGGALAISANRINVVGDDSQPADGLTLDNDTLAGFGDADELRLTSYTTLDLYGAAVLGTDSQKSLVISAAGIAGHGEAGTTAVLAAENVRFDNPNPDSAQFETRDALGGGSLVVRAQTVSFGGNATNAMRNAEEPAAGFAVRGFADVVITAGREARFEGVGVTRVEADSNGAAAGLTLDAGRVVAGSGADHSLRVSGQATLSGGGNSDALADLGGRLDLGAADLTISGRVLAPAGSLNLTATAGDVQVASGAVIAAEGVAVAFADTWAYAPGGRVRLHAEQGNVTVAERATLSVSAHAAGGGTGRLELRAVQGTVSAAAGSLKAAAGAEGLGELVVEADSVDLDALVDAARHTLADGTARQHFTGLWDIRRRNGGLTLLNDLTSERVRLAADNGGIRIGRDDQAASIDASGAQGGEIELYSRNGDVVLGVSSQLRARGLQVVDNVNNAGTRGRGGRVTLGASGGGRVITEARSLIDVGVAEGSKAEGGKVVFRADRSASIADRSDLNIRLDGGIQGASEVSAEFVSPYTGSALNAGSSSGTTLGLTSIKADLNALYSADNMSLLRSHLGFADALYHVRPGVEIATPVGGDGSFTISGDLDLTPLRFQGEAGVLTIRAAGDLKVNTSISDGFTAVSGFGILGKAWERDAKIAFTTTAGYQSWSYRLTAGADGAAADPLAVRAASPADLTGSIQVAKDKLIRTGTGDIALAARRDITLASGAAVYTAGAHDPAVVENFNALTNTGDTLLSGNRNYFPVQGGDLKARAGGSISQEKENLLTDWLVRYNSGSATTGFNSTQWWPRIASFRDGFAVFGGGDIDLAAGGDLTRVSVASPTNGRIPGTDGAARADLAVILGGGNVRVRAGGSVTDGVYYAESGAFSVTADRGLTDPEIGLGNAAATLISNGNISVAEIYNPLVTRRGGILYKNSTGQAINSGVTLNSNANSAWAYRIGTYGPESAIDVLSVTGQVTYDNAKAVTDGYLLPAKARIAALLGDIAMSFSQMPGINGQLDVLGGGRVTLGRLKQYDVDRSALISIVNPLSSTISVMDPFDTKQPVSVQHAAVSWHQNDTEPSRVIALTGDIDVPLNASGVGQVVNVEFNEPLTIAAGDSIVRVGFTSQHLRDEDVTRVSVGQMILVPTDAGTANPGNHVFKVLGPGRLELSAGSGVDLGTSNGIVTRGNLDNPFLPEGGASVFLVAGATPDYAGFRAYLGVGEEVGDAALRDRFYAILREQGRAAVGGGGQANYEEGRAAIAALFPADAVSGGDVSFFASQIKTEQGGAIDLLVPGGGITVGIANPSASQVKAAADQGLFTVRGGDIRVLTRDDFLVNKSRVFTLDGGDILVWSDQGNIDAGSGAKTVNATPPPVLVFRDGQVVLDTSAAVTGSGIATLASQADTTPSDLDLFAPEGAIDAGDAGLRSTGNVFLGATQILNSSNIQVGGVAAGVPVSTSGLVTFSGVSSTSESTASTNKVSNTSGEGTAQSEETAKALQQALASFKPSFITVEVLGFGDAGAETSGKPDEEERRRQRQGV